MLSANRIRRHQGHLPQFDGLCITVDTYVFQNRGRKRFGYVITDTKDTLTCDNE